MRSSPAMTEEHRRLQPLLQDLGDRWWVFLLRGLASVAFGVLAFLWPGATLLTLVLLYGVFVLADSVLAIIGAIRGPEQGSRWWLALVGVLGIAAAAVTLLWPGITSFVLLMCIGIWAIGTGVAQVLGAISMRHEIDHEWLLIAAGAVSVMFGTVILTRPASGALALVLVISAYAIMYGIILMVFAWRLRGFTHQHDHSSEL